MIPTYEVHGTAGYQSGDHWVTYEDFQIFSSMKDALGYAEKNLEQYVIHMKMLIEEKRNGKY